VSDEHVQAVIDLNARSIIRVTRAAAPWLERQGGFVINTTSIAAQ
jgi:3-oxoacyl-[acyl-carrier protein] reductase